MIATTPAEAAIVLPFVLPVALWVAWSDMKFMRIPNAAVLSLVAVFATVGLAALPLEIWAWRWTHLAVVLGIGFAAHAAGAVGGGDAKFAAAMAPFFATADLRFALALFAACILGAFACHRAARALAPVRALAGDWRSWTHPGFPMGLALSGTLVLYLAAALLPA
jgi:prepilin peptidase CpaA